MPVNQKVRKDVQTVPLSISRGEYLQYVVATAAEKPRFMLSDANTGEVILSDRANPTLSTPSTFFRLWPVVGDLSRREALLVLTMYFDEPNTRYVFQVQHHRDDGAWHAMIDIEFTCAEIGLDFSHRFKVLSD